MQNSLTTANLSDVQETKQIIGTTKPYKQRISFPRSLVNIED